MKLLFTEKHIVRMNLSKFLSCTDLCPCQAGDLCRNENTHLAISRNTDEDDDI
jgi:hypothetical protein